MASGALRVEPLGKIRILVDDYLNFGRSKQREANGWRG